MNSKHKWIILCLIGLLMVGCNRATERITSTASCDPLVPCFVPTLGTPASSSSLTSTATAEASTPTLPPENIARVGLVEAKRAYDEKTAVFLDVRSLESYSAAHIPGAVFIPVNELASRWKELNSNDWIITYCT